MRTLGGQVAGDLRLLPRRLVAASHGELAVQRCHNIGDFERQARRSLPRPAFDYIDGAASDEITARWNREDFLRYAVRPRAMVDVSHVSLATTVQGTPVSMPILGAPTGISGVAHPAGEVALARALHAAGSVYVLSSGASYTIEEVAARAGDGPTWFQTMIWKDRGLVRSLLERAQIARLGALVITVDTPVASTRERDVRNGFTIPPRVTLRSLSGGIRHPRWTLGFIRHGRVTTANTIAPSVGAKVLRDG